MDTDIAMLASPVVAEDIFNRADSATTLGYAPSGQVWTAPQGTWSISSNEGYSVSDATNDMVILDTRSKNIDLTILTKGQAVQTHTRMAGVVFRATNINNNLRVGFSAAPGTPLTLSKISGGTVTVLASSANTVWGNDTYYEIRTVVSGASIVVYVNNTAAITHTLSGADFADFGTQTNAGMRLIKVGAPSVEARVNKFEVIAV